VSQEFVAETFSSTRTFNQPSYIGKGYSGVNDRFRAYAVVRVVAVWTIAKKEDKAPTFNLSESLQPIIKDSN